MTRTSAYGSWPSPLSAATAAVAGVRLREPRWDGGSLYWIEGRPAEGGRQAIVRRDAGGTLTDAIPRDFNARSRVHEYGGGAYAVADGVVYFSHFADNRLYRCRPGEAALAITAPSRRRYADLSVDRQRARLVAVCEDHGSDGEPRNTVVAIAIADGTETTLAEGADFYAFPRLSPDGRQLAWLSWNHPDMPWDSTRLEVAELDAAGRPGSARTVADGERVSLYQPAWSPGGVLHFVSDAGNGWWNLYAWRDGRTQNLWAREAEFGLPLWVFGSSTHAFLSETEILCAYTVKGVSRLGLLSTAPRGFRELASDYTDIDYVVAENGMAAVIGTSPTRPAEIAVGRGGELRTVYAPAKPVLPAADVSVAQPVEFPTTVNRTAFGFFYPPRNSACSGPPGTRPPLIVVSHGGPTGNAAPVFDLGIQYWTTRGFGVLDVNYGGSTGFGRAYRERLYGAWGVVDVEDCISGARHLGRLGWIDAGRCAIRGGSAGGYTTLCALVFHDFFRAGASHYGVSDIAALSASTHKFESRYEQRLIGSPEKYRERSPIHFVDRLACPVIFFQGLDDKVVPPEQSEKMAIALRDKGLPVAYVAFPGEGHGLRKAENIQKALEAELYFYSRVFHFELPDALSAVPIENL